jgi:hypothetical protein
MGVENKVIMRWESDHFPLHILPKSHWFKSLLYPGYRFINLNAIYTQSAQSAQSAQSSQPSQSSQSSQSSQPSQSSQSLITIICHISPPDARQMDENDDKVVNDIVQMLADILSASLELPKESYVTRW